MKIRLKFKLSTRWALTAFAFGTSFLGANGAAAQACSCQTCNWSQVHGEQNPIKGSPAYFSLIEPGTVVASSTASSTAIRSFVPTQTVFLDFDTATGAGEYVYTATDRTDVRDAMAAHYAQFNFAFTNTLPVSGDFSTITFNSGSPGGLADKIDFRNTDMNDNAVVNVNGLGLTTSSDLVAASIGIGSHELGHLVGLRHADSFGSIGTGIAPAVSAASFNPSYPGPSGATETNSNIMASPASVGSSLTDLLTPNTLSTRSAIKLAFNEGGTVTAETGAAHGTIGTAQALSLPTISVPNTSLASDALFGLELQAEAEVILGEISAFGESDFYSFTAEAGDLFNIELMSSTLSDRIGNIIDPTIALFQANGDPLDYYGVDAFNDDELENFDSTIIDLVIADAGTYFIEVTPFSGTDTGEYELFVSRFSIVPEPGSFGLLMFASAGVLIRRRRRA